MLPELGKENKHPVNLASLSMVWLIVGLLIVISNWLFTVPWPEYALNNGMALYFSYPPIILAVWVLAELFYLLFVRK